MGTFARARTTGMIALALAVGAVGPSALLVDGALAKARTRHCVKYKTVKTKQGKKVQRCAKYKK